MKNGIPVRRPALAQTGSVSPAAWPRAITGNGHIGTLRHAFEHSIDSFAISGWQPRLTTVPCRSIPEAGLWFAKTLADFEANDIAALRHCFCYKLLAMFSIYRSVPRNAGSPLARPSPSAADHGIDPRRARRAEVVWLVRRARLDATGRLTGNLGTGTGMKPCRLCAKAAQKPSSTYVSKWLILLSLKSPFWLPTKS